MRTFFLFAPLALAGLVLPAMAQDRGDRDRGPENRADRAYTSDQAVQTCKDSIQQEARERFGTAAVNFRQTNMDNNPGRNDWVVGTIAIKTSRWRPSEVYRFSCSVDFSTGRVRSAHIGVPNY
jgi:hypothetical protein